MGYIQDEVVIYARSKKIIGYIFHQKTNDTIYFGVTDFSFTFHPNKAISIYTEEFDSLEEVPLFIDICFVNGPLKVNKYRKDFQQSPIQVIMLSFRPRIYSSSFNVSDMENPIPGVQSENIVNSFCFPSTGIRKKELLKHWMFYKAGIQRQISGRETGEPSNVVHRVLADDNLSDEEPADVRRERLQRRRAIEAAIEAAKFDYDIVSLQGLPEPDANGYINFNDVDQIATRILEIFQSLSLFWLCKPLPLGLITA